MKRKTFPILLCFLVCLSLIGVGFAGWVITGSDEKTIDDGQIQVDAVTDNRYTIEAVGWKDSKNTINFVCDTTGTNFENPWLTSDSSTNQNLSVAYQFKVKQNSTYLTNPGTIVTAKATLGNELKAEVSKGDGKLVKLGAGIDLDKLTVGYDSTNSVLYVTLTFEWGELFGGQNPYKYYNSMEGTSDQKNAAKEALEALNALNSQKITITITAK